MNLEQLKQTLALFREQLAALEHIKDPFARDRLTMAKNFTGDLERQFFDPGWYDHPEEMVGLIGPMVEVIRKMIADLNPPT